MKVNSIVPLLGLSALTGALFLGLSHRPDPIDLTSFPALESELETLAFPAPALFAGRVVDAQGEGIAEALVAVENRDRLVFTHADGDGRFQLEGVPPTEFEALVMAFGHQPARLPVAGPTDDGRLVLGVPFDPPPQLEPREESPLDGLAVLLGGQSRGLDVQDAQTPYQVWLEPVEQATAISRSLRIPRRANVAAGGRVRLEDLAHGRYRVHLLPPWARGGTWPDIIDPTSDVEFDHPASAPPVWRATQGQLNLAVTRDGQPLEGAQVRLERTTESGPLPWPAGYTDEDGWHETSELPSGKYRVKLYAGELRLEQDVVLEEGQQLTLGPLELRASE